MVSEEKARQVKIARMINLILLASFVFFFWIMGAPPWWAAVPAGFLAVPALDHHYAGFSTAVLVVVLLALGSVLMGKQAHWTEFKRLDVNEDGYLAAVEYQGTEESFRETDKNGDDRLSRAEYVFMRR